MKEIEIIDIIENSEYKNIYKTWENAQKVNSSINMPKGVYYVKVGAKVRWINPLVKGKRIYNISSIAKNWIDNNLSFKMDNYVWLNNVNF